MGRVVTSAAAQTQRQAWQEAGLRVVFTNGHFDLLHLGHVDYLVRARALGDALIVGVNGDDSTRALKGPQRPLVTATERAALLAALACVDLAVIFEDLTAEALAATLRPDVYVKGGDWDPGAPQTGAPAAVRRGPPEAAVVQAYGGQVRFLPYLADHSTSALIARIVERFCAPAAGAGVERA